MGFKKRFLLYTLVPLFVFFITVSYYRFFVIHDYVISYESECDPNKYDCFKKCADDACTSQTYYKVVEKYAPIILHECGATVEDCSFAKVCTKQNGNLCVVTYCDPLKGLNDCDDIENI